MSHTVVAIVVLVSDAGLCAPPRVGKSSEHIGARMVLGLKADKRP